MSGMDILTWMRSHRDWFRKGKWSDERYALPVRLTRLGKEALFNRAPYDMEPIYGGLAEPGYVVTPWPIEEEPRHAD